ncbi:unnamed protein product, partial [Iphiclides podalirius]
MDGNEEGGDNPPSSKRDQGALKTSYPGRSGIGGGVDVTLYCSEAKKEILTLLSGIDLVNFIVSLLSIEFHTLEVDLKKEQQMRQKSGTQNTESFLIPNVVNGICNDFEQSDSARRVRLVLSEILQMQAQIAECQQNKNNNSDCSVKPSELFDNDVYLEEITDVICISLAELPNLLNITDIVEVLLHVNKGPIIISWVVANMPDTLYEVAESLVVSAEKGEEGGIRAKALISLCAMCPYLAATVRAKAVSACRLPALVLNLTLIHHPDGLVPFISGLLLGSDQTTRGWGIAGIKFQDDEVSGLLRLVTQKPPPTPAGVRFVSLSLCMILACPSLMAASEHEKNAIEWVQWLVKEEAYFESNSGVTASFGEMLLLIAIHFHSGQLAAVGELVCATLGMRVPVRPNGLARIKQAFTQEIFTEQVVTAHAVKVPRLYTQLCQL